MVLVKNAHRVEGRLIRHTAERIVYGEHGLGWQNRRAKTLTYIDLTMFPHQIPNSNSSTFAMTGTVTHVC